MVLTAEVNWRGLDEVLSLIPTLSNLHNEDVDFSKTQKLGEDLTELIAAWQAKQAVKDSQNMDLQQKVAEAERRLVSAKMDGSSLEELERVREQLAQAQARERQMQADILKSVSRQLRSKWNRSSCRRRLSRSQMQTRRFSSTLMMKPVLLYSRTVQMILLAPAARNELSLFLNVSSILPELGDPKFSGTFVDKQRGVKTFKFLASEMSEFETCNAAWDMMR